MPHQILLQYTPPIPCEACGLCGQAFVMICGVQLVRADTGEPVCPSCGKLRAPVLTALVDLAEEARRVGQIGRHTVFPPYTALLDLARAADTYVSSLPSSTAATPPTLARDAS